MKLKEFLNMLVTTRVYELDLKVQIGNCYIDIDSIDIEDEAIVLNVFSELPVFISPIFSVEGDV